MFRAGFWLIVHLLACPLVDHHYTHAEAQSAQATRTSSQAVVLLSQKPAADHAKEGVVSTSNAPDAPLQGRRLSRQDCWHYGFTSVVLVEVCDVSKIQCCRRSLLWSLLETLEEVLRQVIPGASTRTWSYLRRWMDRPINFSKAEKAQAGPVAQATPETRMVLARGKTKERNLFRHGLQEEANPRVPIQSQQWLPIPWRPNSAV